AGKRRSYVLDDLGSGDDDETQVNGHVSLLPMDNVVPERDSNSFPLFGTSAERASPFASSANGLSDSKPSASSDPKALESTRLLVIYGSSSPSCDLCRVLIVTTNDHAKLIESNKVENGNDHKSANIFGKVESNKAESGCYQQPTNIFGKSESKDGKGNDRMLANEWQKLGTSVINDKDLKSNSPFASTPFSTTTTTTGSGLFGSSSLAVTSTTKNQSLASFFNVTNEAQANTQVVVTPSVPFLFGSGTTSIPSSTSGTSPFSSSASTIGTSSSFGISSMTASSHGNYGNFTSGPATSIFGSIWDPVKYSTFGTTYNFGASATPSTTTSPVVFGASSSRGSTKYSFGAGADATSSFSTPTQNQSPLTPVFGNSTSGPATSIFGSTWDLAKSSGFSLYNFGASATSTPSATTSPLVFGASSTRGSTKFSFGAGAGATSSFSTPTQNQSPLNPVFGNSTSGPVTNKFWSTWDPKKSFGFGTTYNDHMSMDSMEEDCM
ncbi:hypothetical protein Tco_1211358, partial [Tanacetum coccineum]